MLRVQLLGPVSLELDGRTLDISRAMELALVARLALDPGRVVSSERLVDDLWGERLTRNPIASLQTLVYRLRRSLGDDTVVRREGGGYIADIQPDDVDATRFDSLIVRARRDAAVVPPADRREVLQQALALWKGPAMAGLEVPFAHSQRARLETARLFALEERIDADLACGAHREVVGELEGLVRDYPDQERLWGQLMLALYRSGSQGAALRAYDRLRQHLVDALGVNPSVEINVLERAILLQDPSLTWSPPKPGEALPVVVGGTPGIDPPTARAGIARTDEHQIDGHQLDGHQVDEHQPDELLLDPSAILPSYADSPPGAQDPTIVDLIRAARRIPAGKHVRRSGVLPFVGRDGQLAALGSVLQNVDHEDEAVFAVVGGRAGNGKTRVLEEFAARSRNGSRLVVMTSCEDDDVLPYRPFADLVREVLASPGAAACLEQMGALVADLVWLVPTAAALPVSQVSEVGLARMRLFEAVVELSQIVARQQELLFIVDDAHRMGLETASLLGLLLDRVTAGRLTIVFGARDDAASRSRGLRDLVRRHDPIQVEVGPLTAAQVEEIMTRLPGSSEGNGDANTAAALYGQTGGVPLLLSTLLAAQQHQGNRTSLVDSDRVDIDSLVAARTRLLSPAVREMLQVAALVGSDVSPDLVANVTGGDSRFVRRALDLVVDSGGLLDGGLSEDDYSWRHPLVRQAVIDSLDQPAERRFREAVGDAWADQGEALRAARQAVEVLELSSRRLLPFVIAGVDEALRTLAFELAEELCRQALDLGGRSTDPSIVVGLLNRLGLSLAYRARRDDAIRAWEEAAKIARSTGRADLIVEVALATAPYARSTVDFPLRWTLLNEVLPGVAALAAATQIQVISAWVDEGTLNHHAVTDPALSARALSLARDDDDDTLLATALVAVHNARRATREVPVDVSAELCQVADRMGSSAWQGQAHLAVLIDAVSLADTGRAETHLESYLRSVDAMPSPRSRWEASMVRSTWALLRGNHASSEQHAQAALETGHRYGIEDAALAFTIHVFFSRFHTGTLDRLVGPLSQYSHEHPEIPAWRAGTGLAMVAAGDLQGARTICESVVPQIINEAVDPTWPIAACGAAQLCWETAAGDELTKPLLQVLSEYRARVAVLGRFIGEFGPVDRYLGLLGARHGDRRARRWLESAAAVSDTLGGRLWAERARQDLSSLS